MITPLLIGLLAAAGATVPAPVAEHLLATSDGCGSCHRDIHRMWRASAHSRSMENTVFQDSLRDTEAREGAAASRLCLRCHAPMVEVTGDWKLRQRSTWEGVSCDFCHSLVSVDLSGPTPRQIVDVGRVKRGPIKDAASIAHEVAYSELHTSSLACIGCHEFVNSEGTPILSTHSEWKESSAAKNGSTCQTCHMGLTRADVVDPRVQRSPRAEVNLHEVPGGHSLEQLHKALAVGIDGRRVGTRLTVEVRLTNKGAGHAVPTGMPGRRIFLDLEVRTSDGATFREKRTYGKFFANAAGKTITRDSEYFARGVRLESDSRIRADERRTETFGFDVPETATAFVTVKLHYEHAPMGGTERRTWLTFLSENRTLLPETRSP